MKKSKSLRFSVISLYITSLVTFVAVLIAFTVMYQKNYVDSKMFEAREYLSKEDIVVEDAIYHLSANGYTFKIQSEKLNVKDIHEQDYFKDQIRSVDYKDSGKYGYIIINDGIEAHINDSIITEFTSDLYFIIIATVLIFIGVTLIFIQYFVFQIVNPLTAINAELRRISEFDFEGAKLDFKSHGEIQDLVKSVENIKVSLKSYNTNRTSLVSAFVHELKSPVATISSVLQLNKMKHEKYDDETTVKIIEESIDTISVITNMSLEIFEKRTIYRMLNQDIVSFISNQLILVKPKLDEKKLVVQMSSEETVWNVDEDSFTLIISNLLNNICSYAKKGSTVEINVATDFISFTNVIATEFTSGTGKGLKIISSLLNDMELNLEYYEDNGKYHVLISRNGK